MNERQATKAIQTLIGNNKATLVTGIKLQDQVKYIQQVERNQFAVPQINYYYVSIQCTNAYTRSADAYNDPRNVEKVYYDIVVHVSDFAIPQQGDTGLYDTVVDNFRLLCDRIVKLIYDTKWYPNSTATPRFRLAHATTDDGRRETISKTNLSDTWVEAQQGMATQYSRIGFTLIEHFADTSKLYP